MVYRSDEHMCKHLQQPLACEHYYHSKSVQNRLCTAEGLNSRGLRLVNQRSFIIKPYGVNEHDQRFSKSENDLTQSAFRLLPLQKSFWCYVKEQTKRCS